MNDDHLPIDDGLTRSIDGASNDRKSFGPVQPVARVDFLATAVDMNLHAIAVIFDFMKPKIALGRFGLQGGKLGFNEPRHLNTLCHLGNSQKPAAPWGQRRAFYLLRENSEQSGDVSTSATTEAIWRNSLAARRQPSYSPASRSEERRVG